MMLSGLGATTAVTPGVATIASTIQTVEGYYPGSIGRDLMKLALVFPFFLSGASN